MNKTEKWKVVLSREAKKQYKRLSLSGQKKPSILDVIDTLVLDMQLNGPMLKSWPNYGLIQRGKTRFYHHCHLKKGQPNLCCLLGS